MKSLIFDIYGDFGHFKKYYTTSSPLTFSFPPPPTIKGMLGAIGGISKTEYLTKTDLPYTLGMIILDIIAPVLLMFGLVVIRNITCFQLRENSSN